jgi:hypothetical protein
VYREHFVRIFFHWETDLHKRNHELTILVYFEPPHNSQGQLDERRLTRIHDELRPGLFSSRTTRKTMAASHLVYHTPFNLFTTRRRIQRRLDSALDTVLSNKLAPITEARVHELVKSDPWLHGPDIEYFQQAYGAAT